MLGHGRTAHDRLRRRPRGGAAECLDRTGCPAKYEDVGPRIIRAPMGEITFIGGKLTVKPGTEGRPTDWWYYEELKRPLLRVDAAVGVPRDEVTMKGITYEDMRPGSYEVKPRLEDMDLNHLEASLCFPTFPRFCGQTFSEAAGQGPGPAVRPGLQRLDGRGVVRRSERPAHPPEPHPAVGRRAGGRRGAAQRGTRGAGGVLLRDPAVPGPAVGARPRRLLGPVLPGLRRDRHRRQHAHRLVVEDAVDLGRRPPGGGLDAHPHQRHLLAGRLPVLRVLVRFPDLKLAYSEGQIGWIPYILERADKVWEENRGWGGVADKVPDPPSTYFRRQIYGCFFDDAHGLRSVEEIGADNITYESDYPHSDSTWPHTKEIAESADGAPRRRASAQDRPGQRHPALRARPPGALGRPGLPARRSDRPRWISATPRARSNSAPELRAWLADVLPTLAPKPSSIDWPGRRVVRHHVAAHALRRRLRRHRLARRGRGPGGQPGGAAHLPRGARAGPRPLRRGELRRPAARRADRRRRGHARTAGPLPAADPPRRRGVVPGVLRARGRQRPGLAAHPGRPRRRRVRRERIEDLDLATPRWPTTASCWCAPVPRTPATGASRGWRCPWTGPASTSGP